MAKSDVMAGYTNDPVISEDCKFSKNFSKLARQPSTYLLLMVGNDAPDKVRRGLPQGVHQVSQLLLQ